MLILFFLELSFFYLGNKMKINIGYIISTLRRSGPVMQLLNIVKYINREKFNPIIITLSPEENDSMQDSFFQAGIPVVPLNLSRIEGIFKIRKKLSTVIEEYQLHLLHTTGLRADAAAQKFPDLANICSVRNYPYHDYCMKYGKNKGLPIAFYHTSILQKNKYNVACSHFIHNQLEKKGIKSYVISNGVDTQKFIPAANYNEKIVLRRKFNLPENGFIWITTGSLIERKDPVALVEAFIRFVKLNMNFSTKNTPVEKLYLVIVGDGVLRPQIETLDKHNSCIIYAGSSAKVRDYLAASDAFISASFSEGLPNGVLEALSCNLPTILSDIPPHNELPGSVYFQAGNGRELTYVLDKFYKDRDKYKGRREIIEQQFDCREVSLHYQELYFKSLGKPTALTDNNFQNEEKSHNSYSKTERSIASLLSHCPKIKKILKKSYVTLNYALFRSKNAVELADGWNIETCTEENCFFGYYDRSPVNENGHLLYNKILPEGNVGLFVDNKMLAVTGAWNFQQGALASWIEDNFFIYNCFDSLVRNSVQLNKGLGCRKINAITGEEYHIPFPVYSAVPGCDIGLSLNFDRITYLRPEYGYTARSVAPKQFPSPEDDGVFAVNLKTGETKLLFSFADLSQGLSDIDNTKQKINHIQLSPDGKRCIFLYRWFDNFGVKHSRLYFARLTDGYLALLADEGMVSHCNFVDEIHVGGWMCLGGRNGYYCIDTQTGYYRPEAPGVLNEDGHPTFCGRYLITDTYPDRSGIMKVLVYDRYDRRLVAENRLFSPLVFRDEKRCDLHPRPVVKDGRIAAIYIDSTHSGKRRLYQLMPEKHALCQK